MRLTDDAKETIRRTASEVFVSRVDVRLFGSRADDAETGGDLDLLVVSEEAIPVSARKILRFVARLQLRLGDHPIDAVLIRPTDAAPADSRAGAAAGRVVVNIDSGRWRGGTVAVRQDV